MKQIDLEPSEYRVKRGSIRHFISSKPYMRLATASGVWFVSVAYVNMTWLHWLDFWGALAVAVAPIILTLILWFRSGGEDQSA